MKTKAASRVAVRAVVMAAIFSVCSQALAVEAQPKRSWRVEKCARYARDWSEALRRFGEAGLSREFIDGNRSFIAGGCSGGAKFCPTTPRDRDLADILAIRVVNESMSTTFLPFACSN